MYFHVFPLTKMDWRKLFSLVCLSCYCFNLYPSVASWEGGENVVDSSGGKPERKRQRPDSWDEDYDRGKVNYKNIEWTLDIMRIFESAQGCSSNLSIKIFFLCLAHITWFLISSQNFRFSLFFCFLKPWWHGKISLLDSGSSGRGSDCHLPPRSVNLIR